MEIIIHTENFKSAAVSHMIVSSLLIHVRNREMKWVERQKRRKTEVTYERRKEVVQLWERLTTVFCFVLWVTIRKQNAWKPTINARELLQGWVKPQTTIIVFNNHLF